MLARYWGLLCISIGALMLPSIAWGVWYREWGAFWALVGSALVSCALGGGLLYAGRGAPNRFFERETLAFVGVSWIMAAGLGALPFMFSGVFGFVDAYFESMSGFTTTGASVLVRFDDTPRCIMFWRSFTHWLGGMGIVVLFIAVLPYVGAGGKQLFRSEAPGPNPQGLKPRIQDTASILYKIYLGMTLLQTVALMFAGMTFFDALCHTFGTLATGGFSTHVQSVSGYQSVAVEIIIIVFMICAGSNFGLYFLMLRGNWRALYRDSEWRAYILILVCATLLITLNLLGLGGRVDAPTPSEPGFVPIRYDSPVQALRDASFQTVSVMTTTGFITADFDMWPYLSRVLLVVLMFVGGCAGSTGGGIKVVRVVMLFKMVYWRLEATFRPKTVRAIRINGEVVGDDVQRTAAIFFMLWLGIFAFGALFMSFIGLPFQSALTSVAATLNNIGPGLSAVGARTDYHLIPAAGKLFLSLCMVLGRLELFSICVLFLPSFWRHA